MFIGFYNILKFFYIIHLLIFKRELLKIKINKNALKVKNKAENIKQS